jgi:hypothetical protein
MDRGADERPRTITRHWAKPIPLRQFDWEEDGGDERMVGCGRTETEAIDDLRRLLQERAEWQEWEAER